MSTTPPYHLLDATVRLFADFEEFQADLVALIEEAFAVRMCAWCSILAPFPEGFQRCGNGRYRPECKDCSNGAARIRRLTPKSQALQAARSRKRRARLAGADLDGHTAEELVQSWIERGHFSCVYCGAEWDHVDHLIPLALGGSHSIGNLVPSCASCNLEKGASDPWTFLEERGLLPAPPEPDPGPF